MKIAFVCPYPPDKAPSQRFRFEQYFQSLSEAGVQYHIYSFLSEHYWNNLYVSKGLLFKIRMLTAGFLKRFLLLFKITSYDFVFLHREATPVGPPVFEWLIAKVFQKKIIYDFDDAIWLTDKVRESLPEKLIRFRSKVGLICKWSYAVSCGNEYLCEYARLFAGRVVLNPTTVDTDKFGHSELYGKKNNNQVVVGWTGSHSTLKYLKEMEPVFIHLRATYPEVRVLVIADKKPQTNLQIDFVLWNSVTEAEDLARIDIGIMPLPDDEWAKGKCGLKALQYMALGIPAVVSPVGVNSKIIKNDVTGYLCKTHNEWIAALEKLIVNSTLRHSLGVQGRAFVQDHYSVRSNKKLFLSLFNLS
ncbi:MAG: glycosyl transferase [Bacteroidota bacterium]|nr:MAG: glycosyl transferase [Bacteroidota bacterium]